MHNSMIKVALFLNYALFAILLNSVGTVILQVQISYGVVESQAAILEAFKDLSIAIASFLATSLAVRAGFRRSIILAVIAVSLTCLIMPLVPAFWMNKLMFAVTGVTFALVKVSTYSALGVIAKDKQQHASLMSFIEAFFMVGIFLSYFLFSWFVDDQTPGSSQWLEVYWAIAAIGATCVMIMLFAQLDESDAHLTDQDSATQNEFSEMFKLVARPLIILFVISTFLYILLEQSIMTWLPTFNNSVLNMSPSLSIQMASILALSFAIGRFIAGFVLRKVNWFTMVICCLILAAGLVLAALPMAANVGDSQITSWSTAPLAAYVFPMLGICLAPIYPTIVSVMLSELPKHQHAPMSGLIIIFGALGGTSGSIITGNLFEHIGGSSAFYMSLLPMALITLALFLFKRLSQPAKPLSTSARHT